MYILMCSLYLKMSILKISPIPSSPLRPASYLHTLTSSVSSASLTLPEVPAISVNNHLSNLSPPIASQVPREVPIRDVQKSKYAINRWWVWILNCSMGLAPFMDRKLNLSFFRQSRKIVMWHIAFSGHHHQLIIWQPNNSYVNTQVCNAYAWWKPSQALWRHLLALIWAGYCFCRPFAWRIFRSFFYCRRPSCLLTCGCSLLPRDHYATCRRAWLRE
jgi:hypothetical protein